MTATMESPIEYNLPVGDQSVALKPYIGKTISLQHTGNIFCSHCGRKTKKSFSQGFCYPCFQRLAQCDSCIMSPEKCHYHEGTCREPEWGEEFCFQDHYVYLANTTGIKVGITRGTQLPTRWIDQGAITALPIYRVKNRLQSGLVEVVFKKHIADKTNWRAMLKGEVSSVDLQLERNKLFEQCSADVAELQDKHGIDSIQALDDADLYEFNYPVIEHPTKIVSFNMDKNPLVEGQLMGIKGQYLIFDTGVINIRKYTAYEVELTT